MGRGRDDKYLIDVGRDRSGSPTVRHPALEQCRSWLDPRDPMQVTIRLGLELHAVANHDSWRVALHLPPKHRADLAFGGRDAVDRSIPLEDGAEQPAHHSGGVRAIASSSAALTS
jgi:hypothetical protein